jgi:hypothetical protein
LQAAKKISLPVLGFEPVATILPDHRVVWSVTYQLELRHRAEPSSRLSCCSPAVSRSELTGIIKTGVMSDVSSSQWLTALSEKSAS